MTDLYNRRHMQSVLSVELDRVRRYARRLSTIMIDIDDLKSLNDRHAHAAGDRVLRRPAQVMKDNIRASDIPARLGGSAIESIEPFLGQTDQALYEAKNAGGRGIRAGDRMILTWEQASISGLKARSQALR